jgi:hypothetical protein
MNDFDAKKPSLGQPPDPIYPQQQLTCLESAKGIDKIDGFRLEKMLVWQRLILGWQGSC